MIPPREPTNQFNTAATSGRGRHTLRGPALRDPVLEALSAGVAVFDGARRLVTFNSAYATLFDLDMAWLATAPEYTVVLSRLMETRMLPDAADFAAYRAQQLSHFNTEMMTPREEVLHLPDGRSIRHVVHAHPDGGLILTYEDLTRPLALERRHNAQEAVSRVTLDALATAVAAIGGDGCLRLANKTFGTLWNLEPTTIEGRHVNELIPAMIPTVSEQGDEALQAIVTALHDRRKVCLNIERTDGATLAATTLPLPDGAMLLCFEDVTDRLKVETALTERDAAFADAERTKTAFIGNVSFEVRGPLNALAGFSELLTNHAFGPLNARQQAYAEAIRDSASGMSAVLSDILDLAAIEAGQTVLSIEPADVPVLLAETIGLVRERAKAKSVSLEVDCAPDFGTVRMDTRRLKQVLLELLDNAIRYTPERGSVSLSAARRTNGVEISIADTGPGISKGERERIFSPFERGTPASAAPASGAGLGLTIASRFVEMHGGKIELLSRPGRGTTVRCWIPDS